MGIICILLGFIAFFGFILAGWRVASVFMDKIGMLSLMFTDLAQVSELTIYSVIIVLFSFIGLLIGVSLIMQGLTYNKVCKIQTQLRRRG